MRTVKLDHGTGSLLSQELIDFIVSELGECYLGELEDAISLELDSSVTSLAMTTDSFVVSPLFFTNGDIGKISVCGTVNDLAVSGATPKYLTLSFILEEGLPFNELKRILRSIKDTSLYADVKIVAGDTKVVAKGEADKIFINTAGIGLHYKPPMKMSDVSYTDKIIVTGNIGDHTIHLLSMREGLGYERNVTSDCACLNHEISKVRNSEFGEGVKSIRDVTRGGLNQVLHEYANKIERNIFIEKASIPVNPDAVMAADMLDVDLIDLANEGCLCIFVEAKYADAVLEVLRTFPTTKNSQIIGEVSNEKGNSVFISEGHSTVALSQRVGAALPRLC